MLRLSTGEDVIAYLTLHKEGYILREPMVVMLKFDNKTGKQHVLMDHWLPVSIIEHNETMVPEFKVVARMQPSSEFEEYYVNAVRNIQKLKLTSSDEDVNDPLVDMSDEDMTSYLDSIGPVGSNQIH